MLSGSYIWLDEPGINMTKEDVERMESYLNVSSEPLTEDSLTWIGENIVEYTEIQISKPVRNLISSDVMKRVYEFSSLKKAAASVSKSLPVTSNS